MYYFKPIDNPKCPMDRHSMKPAINLNHHLDRCRCAVQYLCQLLITGLCTLKLLISGSFGAVLLYRASQPDKMRFIFLGR